MTPEEVNASFCRLIVGEMLEPHDSEMLRGYTSKLSDPWNRSASRSFARIRSGWLYRPPERNRDDVYWVQAVWDSRQIAKAIRDCLTSGQSGLHPVVRCTDGTYKAVTSIALPSDVSRPVTPRCPVCCRQAETWSGNGTVLGFVRCRCGWKCDLTES